MVIRDLFLDQDIQREIEPCSLDVRQKGFLMVLYTCKRQTFTGNKEALKICLYRPHRTQHFIISLYAFYKDYKTLRMFLCQSPPVRYQTM